MSNAVAITNEEKKEIIIKTWYLLLIITVVSILISFAFQKIIMTREVYYSLYGSQMEDYRIDDYVSMILKFQIWGYLSTPLIIWLRIAFVAFLIQLPFMLKNIEIPFRDIFRIVTIAYFILLSEDVVKIFYLYFKPPEQITIDSLNFIPLALTSFLEKNNYSVLSFSFLSKFNLFELLWCIVVYFGLVKTKKLENIDYILIVSFVWVGILALTFGITFFIRILV